MTAYITKTDILTLGYKDLPDDDILEDICISASAIADNFCNQPLGNTTTEEFVDVVLSNSGISNKIFPSYLPIISVDYVKVYYGINQYEDILVTDYEIDNRSGCIDVVQSVYGKIKIGYKHGYATIPNNAKRAIILIASNLLSDFIKREQTGFEGLRVIEDNALKLQFFADIKNDIIPSSARRILLNYRRVR